MHDVKLVDIELRDGIKAQSTAHVQSKLCAGRVLRAETRVQSFPMFLPLARLRNAKANHNVFEISLDSGHQGGGWGQGLRGGITPVLHVVNIFEQKGVRWREPRSCHAIRFQAASLHAGCSR